MSLLFVSYNQEEQDFTTVSIMRKVANFLFDNVIKSLAKSVKDKDFLDKADADLMLENVNFTDLNQDEFKKAYGLVEKYASDDTLQPYAQEILQKMQADPRYTQPNPPNGEFLPKEQQKQIVFIKDLNLQSNRNTK